MMALSEVTHSFLLVSVVNLKQVFYRGEYHFRKRFLETVPLSERRISVTSKLSDCFASRCCPCSGGAADNTGQCVYKAAFVLEHIMLTENIAKMNMS